MKTSFLSCLLLPNVQEVGTLWKFESHLEFSHICRQFSIMCFTPVIRNFYEKNCKRNVLVYVIVWCINIKFINKPAKCNVN